MFTECAQSAVSRANRPKNNRVDVLMLLISPCVIKRGDTSHACSELSHACFKCIKFSIENLKYQITRQTLKLLVKGFIETFKFK